MATTKVTTGGITDATIATADIADQAVTLAKLPHGTSSNDGKFLRANNGADPSFETVSIPAGTTINNNADNRVITGSGSANTLEGESGFLFDASQRVLLGNSGSRNVGGSTTNSKIQVEGTSQNTSSISLVNNEQEANGPFIFFGKTRGNSVGESGIVQNGDTLGGLSFIGADSVDTNNRTAEITAVVNGSPANNTIPTDLTFSTSTANAGQLAERMRIDSNGDMVLGSTSSLGKLTISKQQNSATSGTFSTPHLRLNATSTTDTVGFTGIAYSVSTLTNYGWTVGAQRVSTSGTDGSFIFRHHSNSATGDERISFKSDGRTAINTVSNVSNRCTSPSSSGDDLVISADGNTGITLYSNSTGATNAVWFGDSDDVDVGSIRYLHGNNQIRLHLNANSTPVMQFNSDLTIIFQNTIYSNGAAYSTGSDLRMKSNLVKFTNTLENLKKITGYKFDITNKSTGHTRKSAGVIAQDVEKVYPEFVDTNPETEMKSLEYNALIGVLVEAVKELTTRVETLEAA